MVCYKCGKIGHYANKCRMKQQIQALTVDDDLKGMLTKMFLNETDSEREDLELNVIDYTSEEESESNTAKSDKETECEGNCDYYKSLCALNGLLVLTKEEDLILDLLDNIEDPGKRKEKLETYIKIYRDKAETSKGPLEKKIESRQSPYDLTEILERVKNSKKSKEPTLKELKQK